jgi:UDP-glucose 4-epimerase
MVASMTWLVTGGAGYIGSHVVRALRAAGVTVTVLDDLTTGSLCRLPSAVRLVVGSVLDESLVRDVLDEHDVEGVVHVAGKKRVAESVRDPLFYYRENVGGCQALLQAMIDSGVQRLVFSSSAAVYGTSARGTVREDAPTNPLNPYGRTKLVCENLIKEAGVAYGITSISLRYFNVAGAADAQLAELGGTNLIPKILEAVNSGDSPEIFGDDYPTADGTCIRDYIHVVDLAEAHVSAARALVEEPVRGQWRPGYSSIYNVGRGQGYSVREVIASVESAIGIDVNARVAERRRGDAPAIVADASAIAQDLGWHAALGLDEMIVSAWTARGDRLGAATDTLV